MTQPVPLSPLITEKEKAFSERVQARIPPDMWDNPLGRLKNATGLRYDALASGGVRLVISHCEIVKGMPRYNNRTHYELVGVFPSSEAMQAACVDILEHMTGRHDPR